MTGPLPTGRSSDYQAGVNGPDKLGLGGNVTVLLSQLIAVEELTVASAILGLAVGREDHARH